MKSSRWLVTGAAGFIGSHVVDLLLTEKQSVLGIDNFSTGNTSNIIRLQDKHGTSWECLHVDITDSNAIHSIVSLYKPDYIVHLAAKVSVHDSVKNPIPTQETNIAGFLNVLSAAKKNHVKRFIYASSCAVYGDQATLPISEDAPLAPVSFYGLTKEINELYAAHFATASFPCIGLRFFNVFGPYQSANSAYAAVIPKWISLLSQGNPITIYGDGSATRDFCHVNNVVEAIFRTATMTFSDPWAIYNIGSGMPISLNELSQRLIQLTRQNINLIHYEPWKEGEILHSCANIEKAKKDWNYRVLVDLETGLGSFFNSLSS